MIFIVGLGRSGTNMLARTILTHPKLVGDTEGPTFQLAVQAALGKRGALRQYLQVLAESQMDLYLKKDHPAMWFWHHIPNTHKGIYITRGFMDYAASCMKHTGVQTWLHKADKLAPNGLSGSLLHVSLGLTMQDYVDLSIYDKLSIRYLTAQLVARGLTSLLHVGYESFVQYPKYYMERIGTHLELDPRYFNITNVRETSVGKYNRTLSTYEIGALRDSYHKWVGVFKHCGYINSYWEY